MTKEGGLISWAWTLSLEAGDGRRQMESENLYCQARTLSLHTPKVKIQSPYPIRVNTDTLRSGVLWAHALRPQLPQAPYW